MSPLLVKPRAGGGRVHHQHIRHACHQGDGGEILHRVIRQLGVERLVDSVRAHGAHEQGVAVGGFGHFGRGGVAARAGFVVDDERLAEGLLQFWRHGARQQIGGAASGKGHHDSHGFGRPSALRLSAEGQQSGNAFRWAYTLALPVDGRVIEVQFDDWMYLMNDKVMLNKAAMRKWGVGLGEVTLSFFKR